MTTNTEKPTTSKRPVGRPPGRPKKAKAKRPVGRPPKKPARVVEHELEDTLDNDLSATLDELEPLPQEVLDNLPDKPIRKREARSNGLHPNSRSKTHTKHTRFDVNKQRQFLKELAKHGNITSAAASVGVVRQTVYALQQRDPRFNARVEIAKNKALGNFENELLDRVMNGNKVTTYDGDGNVITTVVKHDNNLLIKALEANDRERYSKGSGGTVNVNVDTGSSVANKLSQLLGLEVTKEDFEGHYKDITPESDD